MTEVQSATSANAQAANRPADAAVVHKAEHGDTLPGLARANGVSVDALIAANPQIANPDRIFPGDMIRIPDTGGHGTHDADHRDVMPDVSPATRSAIDEAAFDWRIAGQVQTCSSGQEAQELPTYTNQEIADYLRSGFDGAQFDVSSGDELTVNITGLTDEGQTLARAALEHWSDATGLVFTETDGDASITFDDNESGAFAGPTAMTDDGYFESTIVNVGTEWLDAYGTDLDTYSFQTYIHEVGHALGLGHAGPYNGSADFGTDNIYTNDSWQATVMSYFSQADNTNIDASPAYVMGPQVADYIAIQDMYGASTTTRDGDTTYGFDSTAGNVIFDAENGFSNPTTFTIFDTGGTDTMNYAGSDADQTLDLREEQYSSVNGLTGNVGIAVGTVIENAAGGSGDDNLVGNGADNELTGNDGADTFFASGGTDTFVGGDGDDTAIFSGSSSDYTVSTNAAGNTVVTDNRTDSPDGTVELQGVETIEYDGADSHPDMFPDAPADEDVTSPTDLPGWWWARASAA